MWFVDKYIAFQRDTGFLDAARMGLEGDNLRGKRTAMYEFTFQGSRAIEKEAEEVCLADRAAPLSHC